MALSLGTNAGFVSVAPTTDPSGDGVVTATSRGNVTKDTSPSNAGKIIEVGWWCDNATTAADFEVGLYAADGGTVPGEAGTRLFVSTGHAKGTTSGWKTVTVDWTISGNTPYWLGVALGSTSPNTDIDRQSSGGAGYDNRTSTSTLPDPFGGGALSDADGIAAIYAVWQAASSPKRLTLLGIG